MFYPQPVLASDANFDDALYYADGENACPQPDICQQLLAVAALFAGAPQPGALAVGLPDTLSSIPSAPFTVGVTEYSLGSALKPVQGSSTISAPLSFYI